jgi:hypothetical protein
MDSRNRVINSHSNFDSLVNKATCALFVGLFYYYYYYMRPIVRRNALIL